MSNTPLAQIWDHCNRPRTEAQNSATSSYPDPGQKIGIEFEIEDYDGPHFENHWSTHSDASLRNGVEFVFSRGKHGQEISNALDLFCNTMRNQSFNISERTSTHIHMDMCDGQTIGNAQSMFVLTYMIEPAIFRMADENRKWCGYCQPLTDMSQWRITNVLSDSAGMFLSGVNGESHQDKYYGFNLKSLSRHGTIEFRHFPGYESRAEVDKWINLVQEIKLAARSVTKHELFAMGDDPAAIQEFITRMMPRSAAALSAVDLQDAARRARFLQAIHSTESITAPAGVQRLLHVMPDTTAAATLSRLLGIEINVETIRSATIQQVLSSPSLSFDDITALGNVIAQINNAPAIERAINGALANRSR